MSKAEPSSSLLARLVLVHFGALVVFTAWAFGGQAPWARHIILGWGTVGITLFAYAARAHRPAAGRVHPALRLLWPLWLFDLLVLASCFNPGFREIMKEGQASLVLANPIPWLPSAAVPRLAARELWLLNGLVLSSFNLLLVLNRRSQLRAVLFLLAGNAVVLAILGTFQKLTGATGLWFGLVASPNDHFFATFIYHNHWGAFTLLNTAACLALLFHYERQSDHRDIWHSPVPLGAVLTLLLAISIPLSTSRSSTILAVVLLGCALAHLVYRLVLRRRAAGASVVPPVIGLVLLAVLALGAIGFLARGVIAQRTRLTAQQLERLGEEGTLTSRLVLYRDTWHMAQQKPWFGWGLESYGRVFRIFNTQQPQERWFRAPIYVEAHNDWLQSVAEVGFVGTALLVLQGVVALAAVRWHDTRSAVPRYLLGGAALILVYAALEFPFANPAVVLTFSAVFYGAIRYAMLDARAGEDPT